jgi:hypothetical protein
MARLLVVVFCLVSDIAHGGTETELAHLHSVGVIYAIPSDDVDNFLIWRQNGYSQVDFDDDDDDGLESLPASMVPLIIARSRTGVYVQKRLVACPRRALGFIDQFSLLYWFVVWGINALYRSRRKMRKTDPNGDTVQMEVKGEKKEQ